MPPFRASNRGAVLPADLQAELSTLEHEFEEATRAAAAQHAAINAVANVSLPVGLVLTLFIVRLRLFCTSWSCQATVS